MRGSAEFDLIGKIRERLSATQDAARSDVRVGIGDDASVTVPPGATATSVDALVDGVHFRSRWCSLREIGHKAVASALSDLAAMAARPGEAYLWLGRPEGMSERDCLELCDGAAGVCAAHGVALLGGDLTKADVLSLCATVVGHADLAEDFITRSGAEPGDVLAVTGELGGAAAGLLALEHPEIGEAVAPELALAVRRRQLQPQPRFAAARVLADAGARAMIDISDGLGADAEQLASASGVSVEIELDRVPVAAGVREAAAEAGVDPIELVASGGEDYELLCSLSRASFAEAKARLDSDGVGLTEIGMIRSGIGVTLRLAGGRQLRPTGHDHLDR